MKLLLIILALTSIITGEEREEGEDQSKTARNLSVFNVVSFPNTVCAAKSGFNGTCFTATECTNLGGAASGTCASSFGVCCVFSITCGQQTSANNSYAIISSYSVSTDSDPCTYTFCPTSSDVCKLRIDFDTMVLSPPSGLTAPLETAAVAADSITVGDCTVDSLTVSNPGGSVPPTICGYNTGQHMYVPASPQCNQINIDIDTGTTTTTRKWQIKVTQYECGNMMAPEQDCLQYHTAASGTIASFNWDTSSTTVSTTQYHLTSQYYDICIRRGRNSCSVCYSPQIAGGPAATASFGLSAGSVSDTMTRAIGASCTGVTTLNPTVGNTQGLGDYLDIVLLQPSAITAATFASATNRICGSLFTTSTATAPDPTLVNQGTACSFAVPFKVGVHFDADDNIAAPGDISAANWNRAENRVSNTHGIGYSGFYLAYWQNTC